MGADEIIEACKTVLAVQLEVLQKFQKEGESILEELRSINAESKRNADEVKQARNNLEPAAAKIAQGHNKVSWSFALSLTFSFCILITISLWCAFWCGGQGRELEYKMKLESAQKTIQEDAQASLQQKIKSLGESTKWAVSNDGRAARELIKLLKDHKFDYASFDADEKERFFSWIDYIKVNKW